MSDLPTGTITFLFTTIEGSRTRWEQQAQAMQMARAHHDAILREAILAHRGAIVKTIGDGFLAAFATPTDGVATALAAQRALHATDWKEAGPLRVRMALHTGAAEERDGDYFGPTLNRAARLMAVAHGGQVLLSRAAHELVRDLLMPGVEVRDLGEHRLKDLSRLEHIFQVVAPDLPDTFGPLHTLNARANNLPFQPTPLVGRDQDLAALAMLLRRAEVRLVTLTGPGGTGKTRLGLQAAADFVDDCADGVWFVDLAPLGDPGLVASTIAHTLGLKEAAAQPIGEALKTHLHDKQLLLVLDNFEQVVSAAPLLTDLLAVSPRLKVLVTSREVLHLSGEHEYPVPPLALPPSELPPMVERLGQYAAVTLFVERAQAVQPDFQVTDENAPAVAEICVRLDGLPLALELAAARIKVLPPAALLARLDNRLKLLTGGARDRGARQQTLRGAIAWSYDLLLPDEQALFRRLGVFVGGCTLEAIETVCDAEGALRPDVLDLVASLVDKSLLRQEQALLADSRFRMLETIREYAREQLATSGETRLFQHHIAYYLALAEQAAQELTGQHQASWLQRLDAEQDNLRAALMWGLQEEANGEMALRLASALERFWLIRGYVSEGRRWLEQAIARGRAGYAVSATARADALKAAGTLAWSQGDYELAASLLAEGLGLYQELGNSRGVAAVLHNLGNVAYGQGDFVVARGRFQESLALQRELGDKLGVANALNNLAVVAENQGDYATARTYNEEGLVLRQELGDKRGTAFLLNNLGVVAQSEGDYARAEGLFQETLALRRELGDKWGIANALSNLGSVAIDQGDYDRAQSLSEESLLLRQELGDKGGIGFVLHNLGLVALARGEYQEAQAVFEQSRELQHELGDKRELAAVLTCLGHVALAAQDVARAQTCYLESIVLQRELGEKRSIAGALEGLAGATAAGKAREHAIRAVRLLAAAQAIRTAIHAPQALLERHRYDQAVAAGRALLDDGSWEAAWVEGRTMTLEQAIAYALELRHEDT